MALDPKIIKQLRKDVEEINRIYEKIGEQPLKVDFNTASKDDIKLVRDYLAEAKTFVEDLDEGFGGMAQSVRNIVGEWKKGFATPTNEATKSFSKLKGFAEKLSDDFKGISELRGKEVRNIRDQVKVEVERLKVLRAQLKTQKSLSEEEQILLDNLESEYQVQQDILEGAEKRYKEELKIQKAMGLSGAIMKGIKGTLEKIGVSSEYFEGIEDSMREAAKSGSKWQTAMAGVKGVAKGLKEALSDPLVVITIMYKTVKGLVGLVEEFNKGVSDTGKTFGIAGKQAEQTYAAIRSSTDLFNTPEELLKGQQAYNEALGMNLAFNEENAKLMNELTTFTGLSDEVAGKLVRKSVLMGENFKDMDVSMARTTTQFNKQNKVAVPYSKVQKAIAEASSSTLFNIKGGTKGLTEAAAMAARYGRTMDEIKDSAESLLNFEDSISKELEAELFLGKDLNIEKMRYAALTGDTATVQKEQNRLIAQNFKGLKGNVIAQKAFADSLGLSVEQVAKIAEQQEIERKMTPKQLQQQQATAKAQAEQAQKAEEFNRQMTNAINSLKTSLLPLVSTLAPLFEKIAHAMGSIGSALNSGVGKALVTVVGGLAAVGGGAYLGAKIAKGAKNLFSGGLGMGESIEGGDKPGTTKKGLLARILGGGGGKIGESAKNPMYVWVVNQKGGGMSDMFDDGGNGGGGTGRGRGKGKGKRGKARSKSAKRRGRFGAIGSMAAGLMSFFGGGGEEEYYDGEEGGSLADSFAGGADIADSVSSGGDSGGKKGGKNASKAATPKSTPKSSGGFFSKLKSGASSLWGGVKNVGGKIGSFATSVGTVMNEGLGGVKKLLGGPIGKGFSKVLGPIMTAISGISSVMSLISDAQAQKAQGKKVDTGSLGKKIIQAAAYPIANAALNFIPGIGTVVSIADGILSTFDMSPVKWVTDNLIDLVPNDAFDGLGKFAIGEKAMATGGIVNGPTRALVGEAGPEAVVPLDKFYEKLDELITAVKLGGNVYLDGNKVGTAMATTTFKVQ